MCVSSVASGVCAQAGAGCRGSWPGWLCFIGGSSQGWCSVFVLSDISLSSPDLEHICLSCVLSILVPIYF